MKLHRYFVTGIGTGVGKTLVSSILVEALKADYWKPIQAGSLNDSDSLWVREKVQNKTSVFYPEQFKLGEALSPHHAAALDKIRINVSDFNLPKTSNTLIIEGAGGIMVPLNETEFVKDLILQLNSQVIIVCSDYLGCINHSLSAFTVLKHFNIPVKGIVLNAFKNQASKEIIIKHSPWPVVLEVPEIKDFSSFNPLDFTRYLSL